MGVQFEPQFGIVEDLQPTLVAHARWRSEADVLGPPLGLVEISLSAGPVYGCNLWDLVRTAAEIKVQTALLVAVCRVQEGATTRAAT